MLHGKIQKYISDYISRHRNSNSSFRLALINIFKKYLYHPPAKRFERIFRLKKAGRLHEYYLELRDAAIEFSRQGYAGEATKVASLIPVEYINPHLAGCLNIVKNSDGKHFQFMGIEISTVCNLRCPRCHHATQNKLGAGSYPNFNRLMSLDDFKIIWDRLEMSIPLVTLQGMGETFLNPAVYDIIDYMAPTSVYIDTNGNMPMDHERLVGRNLTHLVFSIDGVDQRSYEKYRVGGSFEKVTANLRRMAEVKKRLKAETPKLIFKFISFKHNEMYIDEARRLATDLGADEFLAHPCLLQPPHDHLLDLIYEFVACGPKGLIPPVKYYDLSNNALVLADDVNSPHCVFASTCSQILVDGRIIPCCLAFKLDWPELNLLHLPFDEVWQDPRYASFRQTVLNDRNKIDFCRSCPMAHQNTFPEAFAGTDLAYPESPPLVGSNLIFVDDLKLGTALAKSLKPSEISYFKDAGKYEETADIEGKCLD